MERVRPFQHASGARCNRPQRCSRKRHVQGLVPDVTVASFVGSFVVHLCYVGYQTLDVTLGA